MSVRRTYTNSVAIFVDDLESNFEDAHHCKPVMTIRSSHGKRIPTNHSFWKQCSMLEFQKAEDAKNPIFLHNSGMDLKTIRELQRNLKDGKHPNIKMVFFDWDRTLSAFDGLFKNMTAFIKEWESKHCWEVVRDQMFGGKLRIRELMNLLNMLQENKRVQIITNQDTPVDIRAILRKVAKDFDLPLLAKLPVWAYSDRKKHGHQFKSKFAWMRKQLGSDTCDVHPKS